MSTLVIAAVVNENASVAKAAIPVLIVILAPLWIMIDTRGDLDKRRCFLGALKRARELFLSQIVLSLREVVGVAVLTAVHLRVQLAIAYGL